ncbi:MAG TPA: glycosyltransferase [Actinocrinis sp.]|nr:glycosyltransferase [Actinocrinis sp.]
MPVSYGFLSTSPPTQCGLATFNQSLFQNLVTGPDTGGVVSVVEESSATPGPATVGHLVAGSRLSMLAAAAVLNRYDVAIVQHEYGIYAGRDGDQVLDVLRRLRVPVLVVLHTVLGEPTAHQRQVLEQVVEAADAVVVMSNTSATRLFDGYVIDASKVFVINHGAPVPAAAVQAPVLAPVQALVASTWGLSSFEHFDAYTPPPSGATILSWGLLGPGKGLEWVIDALAELRDLDPAPRYVIAGQTHPKVLEREGEAYRTSLMNRAAALGVGSMVRFDPDYRDTASLMRLVHGADVVVLPYDSSEQATSGVLIEAVAAQRPVIATRFPHACELLADGSGLLVGHRDPAGLAAALRRVLTEPGLAAQMSAASGRLAPNLSWDAVAAKYRGLAADLIAARTARGVLAETAAGVAA